MRDKIWESIDIIVALHLCRSKLTCMHLTYIGLEQLEAKHDKYFSLFER